MTPHATARRTAMALLGALLIVGCDDSTGPETGSLVVQVVDAGGSGVAGVEIIATFSEGDVTRQASRVTGPDGQAVVENAEVGLWGIDAVFPPGIEADPSQILPLEVAVREDESTTATVLVVNQAAG